MTKINKRRDFVKLLTLAGLGLYLPACELDGQKKIDNIITNYKKQKKSERSHLSHIKKLGLVDKNGRPLNGSTLFAQPLWL